MIREVEFFDEPGTPNTASCVRIVKKMVESEGFEHVVVASTSGGTAKAFAEALSGTNAKLVIITHSAGFKEPNMQEFDAGVREELEAAGVQVRTTTILTHSLESAIAGKHQGAYPSQWIAHSLRRWGEGGKVTIEIVMEAADGGLIPEGEDVIAVAGTGHGSDTVHVIRSAASKRFLELRVREVRAMPR
jgi:uncharacterized protein